MGAPSKAAISSAVGWKEDLMVVSQKNEEAAIRHLIEQWASAVRAKDIGGVLAHHTDDVLMFDVPPPVAARGMAAYRETWPAFFKAQAEGKAAFDLVELQVTAGDTVAFATALLRCGSTEELAKDSTPRLRLTIGLRKIDGSWKIAHEHHSFPLGS
jgi:uncharacterized protein (TIGR02246 family)